MQVSFKFLLVCIVEVYHDADEIETILPLIDLNTKSIISTNDDVFQCFQEVKTSTIESGKVNEIEIEESEIVETRQLSDTELVKFDIISNIYRLLMVCVKI